MRTFAAVLVAASMFAAAANAQEISHNWTIQNSSGTPLRRLEIAAGQMVVEGGYQKFKASETISLGENIPPHSPPIRVAINPRTKTCKWLVRYEYPNGGGGGQEDRCGKTRLTVSQPDPAFSALQVTAQ